MPPIPPPGLRPGHVRCYECGTPQPLGSADCRRCKASFRALCECRTEISVFDTACASCGAPHWPRRLPAGRHPAARAAKAAVVVGVLASAAWVAFSPRPVPVWKLKSLAYDAYSRSEHEEAARLYREATERAPADAAAWYMLGVSYRALGMSYDVYRKCAERALLIDHGMRVARDFLTRCAVERGLIERATDLSDEAVRLAGATPEDHALRARIEMMRPSPDLALVTDELTAARAGGLDSPHDRLLLAEVHMRLYGFASGSASRVPPSVALGLREALPALDALSEKGAAADAAALTRSRILLALGRGEEAFVAAELALVQTKEGPPRADGLLARGLALHACGHRTEAVADLLAALRLRPDAETAGTVASGLAGSGDMEAARSVLGDAILSGDPAGAIRAVLATLLSSRGLYAEAIAAILAARGAAPTDASLAEVEGDVRRTQGDFEGARRAYADAVRLAPAATGARVALSLIEATGPTGTPEPALVRSAAAKLEDLLRLRPGDPRVLSALGRLRLLLG